MSLSLLLLKFLDPLSSTLSSNILLLISAYVTHKTEGPAIVLNEKSLGHSSFFRMNTDPVSMETYRYEGKCNKGRNQCHSTECAELQFV